MEQTRKYYEILGELNGLTPDDYEKRQVWMEVYMAIRSLAKRHHRLAEMDCNGCGRVRGQMYYAGAIDDYAKRAYGSSVKSGYVGDTEETIFTAESDKIETKIKAIAKSIRLVVEFQGDPRGATVQLKTRKGQYVPVID
jgi:hypothetical protein